MKLYKMILILVIVSICAVGGMWTLGLVGSSEATEGLNKVISLIVIIGVGAAALFAVVGTSNKSSENSDSTKQGPKF